MAPREKIPNNAEFRRLWESDKTVAQIAAHFGVSHVSSVSKAAKRFGFPRRLPGNGALGAGKVALKSGSKADADAARAAEQEAREASRAGALVPRLTARGIDQDAAPHLALGLVRARAHADLDAVADRHGVQLQRLLPLWHEVRA